MVLGSHSGAQTHFHDGASPSNFLIQRLRVVLVLVLGMEVKEKQTFVHLDAKLSAFRTWPFPM